MEVSIILIKRLSVTESPANEKSELHKVPVIVGEDIEYADAQTMIESAQQKVIPCCRRTWNKGSSATSSSWETKKVSIGPNKP
jgi:hypothetical protein